MARCKRCESHEKDQRSAAVDLWADKKAGDTIRAHAKGSWTKYGHVPSFAELPAHRRTAAKVAFVAERYGCAREAIANLFLAALEDHDGPGACVGPCGRFFMAMEHGTEDMTPRREESTASSPPRQPRRPVRFMQLPAGSTPVG